VSGYMEEDIGLDTPDDYEGDKYAGVGPTSWGQIDSSWLGRRVVVRWEDPSLPLADGLNSGVPHEHRGTVIEGSASPRHAIDCRSYIFWDIPEHAHVQEVPE
jgi:hypothetical protein